MKQLNNVNEKRGRGRPKSETPAPVSAVRLSADVTDQIDRWAYTQSVSRSEAIRRLVEIGLAAKSHRPASGDQQARAAALAAKQIDELIDDVSPDEKATRKRRLTEGPSLFREVRVDRAKAKAK